MKNRGTDTAAGTAREATRLVIQRDAAERLAYLPHKAIGAVLTDFLFWFLGVNPERPYYPETLLDLQDGQRKSLNRWRACRENGERAKRRAKDEARKDKTKEGDR